MLHLINARGMFSDGDYTCKQISALQAKELFQKVFPTKKWKSYIGYPNTAKALSSLFEVSIPINRDETVFQNGDTAIAACLPYRIAVDQKSLNEAGKEIENYNFYYITFSTSQ